MHPGQTDRNDEEKRALLTRVRLVVEHYERHSLAGEAIMRGVRYDLAVRAGDLNGDDCRFPACGCAKADCANRPVPTVPDLSPWVRVPDGERGCGAERAGKAGDQSTGSPT